MSEQGTISSDVALAITADAAATAECPFCREPVRIGATLCPHCRSEQPHVTSARLAQDKARSAKRERGWFIFFSIIAAVMVILAMMAATAHPN